MNNACIRTSGLIELYVKELKWEFKIVHILHLVKYRVILKLIVYKFIVLKEVFDFKSFKI